MKNIMKSRVLYIWISIVALIFVSCAKSNIVDGEKLEKRKDGELRLALEGLSKNSYKYFYAKIATKYKDSTQNVSFKISVRMKKDSVVNTLLTYARLPIYNTLITPDTIKMVDKRDKCVMIESLDYFRKKFAIDVKFLNIEEFFFGSPIGFDESKKYYRVNDPYNYILCSHKKHEIKKNIRKDRREIITYYTLSEDLKSLKQQKIISPQDTTTILIDYIERAWVDDVFLPKNIEITVQMPRQELYVFLDYKKIRLNKKEKIHFVIPEKYGECK